MNEGKEEWKKGESVESKIKCKTDICKTDISVISRW